MKAVIALGLLVSACTPSSADLKPDIIVSQYDNRMYTNVSFDDGGDPATSLDGEFTVTFRGETKVLEHRFTAFWDTRFQLDDPFVADEPITYDFALDGEAATSLTFTITPIVIDPVPLFISRGDKLTFSWAPSVDLPMRWQLKLCGDIETGPIPANAMNLTIPDEFLSRVYAAGTCTGELEIQHEASTPIGEPFAGGVFQLRETPQVWFASTSPY